MSDGSDFSISRLRRVFRAAATAGFAPIAFGTESTHSGRFALWRHDVDLDLAAAREIAAVERDEGVTSTYFLMLQSGFYNLFTREGERTIRELRALGHLVGLHCDLEVPRTAPVSTDYVETRVARDLRLAETMFGAGAIDPVVSFHNPPDAVLRRSFSFYSTYQEQFFGAIAYFSDSNRHFRSGEPEEFLSRTPATGVSILLHPVLWVLPGRTMPEGAAGFVQRRGAQLMAQMEADDIRVR
jgi:hypothetical protein